MSEQYILAIDEGTTSTRAIIFNHAGQQVASVAREFTQYFPKPGWVEHQAEEIWNAVQITTSTALINSAIRPDQLTGGHRDYQPKRNHGGLGQGDGPANLPGHRLAVPAN